MDVAVAERASLELKWCEPVAPNTARLGTAQLLRMLDRQALPVSCEILIERTDSRDVRIFLIIASPPGTLQAAVTETLLLLECVTPWWSFERANDHGRARHSPHPRSLTYVLAHDGLRARPVIQSDRSATLRAMKSVDHPCWIHIRMGTADADGARRCRMAVSGGPATGLIAAIFAEEIGQTQVLTPRLVRTSSPRHLVSASEAPQCLLEEADLAECMSMGARARGAWAVSSRPPVSSEALGSLIGSANPPHVWVVGASGMGKTALLHQMVTTDIAQGHTVLVIDPHGDLANRVAASAVQQGIQPDVFDFSAPVLPAWNLCLPEAGMDRSSWVESLLRVIRHCWSTMPDDYFGPVFTRAMRAGLRVLLEDPEGPWPLTELPKLFLEADDSILLDALRRLNNPLLTRTWMQELLPRMRQHDGAASMNWILSKLDPLVGQPAMARVVGAGSSDVWLSRLLEGRSMVMSLSIPDFGEQGTSLLAGAALARLWDLLRRRHAAQPITVYIDEWHRMAVPDIGSMLAEGRKYGLRMRLANQALAQLPPRLVELVSANSGAIVSFRPGVHDAVVLAALIGGGSPRELRELPDHWVIVGNGHDSVTGPSPAPPCLEVASGSTRALHDLTMRRQHLLQSLATQVSALETLRRRAAPRRSP